MHKRSKVEKKVRSSFHNPGIPLDLAWIRGFSVSRSALESRVAAAEALRLPRGRERAGELLRVLASIDLTTLAGDDTVANVRRLCRTARSPLSGALKKQVGKELGATRVAAVCVFPAFVYAALEALEGTGIPVATVAAGFPHGLSTLTQRVNEVAEAAELGAQEIDVVIRREWDKCTMKYTTLTKETMDFYHLCGPQIKSVS